MTPSQHRRRRIRRTVGAASLATFALAWGVIAGTGAMGRSTATTTQSQSAQSAQLSQQQLPQMTTRQS
jgi:hypothetical protein